MGSFGSVFAIAIVGMVIMTSFGVLAKVLTSYEVFISEVGREARSNPSVTSGYMEGSTTYLVNITLYGGRSVSINKIRLADVFVVYRSGDGKISTRLDYGIGWSISRVLIGDHEGELVNPINLTRETGLWDPGETLELQLSLPSPSETSECYFLIVLPDGGSCSWTFS
ncbi:MAG: hypothetical protein N3D12_06155 [Candidatus Methanomethyliaceae archaeon]|nr:hypothetical protein [Candidatus Methanomethyliaceae archaeon]